MTKRELVNAPLVNELPISLECTLLKTTEDGNIIGQIVNISVDEQILDVDEKIGPAKLEAIPFALIHNAYVRWVMPFKMAQRLSDITEIVPVAEYTV